MTSKQRVIDTHIHLFAKPHLPNLAWMTEDNKLHGNNRLDEYQQVTKSDRFNSQGCIFIESDIKSGLNEDQWQLPIEEYLYVERTVNQQQLLDEGNADGSKFIKAVIPWAPVPLGSIGLAKYVEMLKDSTIQKDNWQLVKGFRYLLQDKPEGTMLGSKFIEGLNWLGENNYIFDLGIDIHSTGTKQLEEFQLVDSKTENVTYIVNHLCKPNFDNDSELLEKVYSLWKSIAETTDNNYYIKLSGGFSELSSEFALSKDLDQIVATVIPWVKIFYDIFGRKKIIWGSDWPVSTLKFSNDENPWLKWAHISEKICHKLNLDVDDVFYQNSLEAYNL